MSGSPEVQAHTWTQQADRAGSLEMLPLTEGDLASPTTSESRGDLPGNQLGQKLEAHPLHYLQAESWRASGLGVGQRP